MILSDREIAAAIENKQIMIDPKPGLELWTSTAVDLTLADVIAKWNDPRPRASGEIREQFPVFPAKEEFNVRQMSEDPEFAAKISIARGAYPDGYPLKPGEFILGYTQQKVYLPNRSRIAARVEGKSSLARLGVGVHVTAPTIHAGFGYNKNQKDQSGTPIRLEIFNLGRFLVYLADGMPICQLILEEVRETPNKGYQGQFSAQEAFVGPPPPG